MPIVTRYRVHTPVTPPPPDPPGCHDKPDPEQIQTLPDLIEALNTAHTWAGEPSFRALSARCEHGQPTHVTFWSLLRAERVPKFDIVLVFIAALGLHDDLEAWANAWRRVRTLDTDHT